MPRNRIAHKRTSTSGLLPNTTNSANSAYIAAGELAINLTDFKVLSSNGSAPFEVGANLNSLFIGTGNVTANATSLRIGTSATLIANGANGTAGQVLTSNGTTVYWSTVSGGSGTPGGANTEIQFNDSGAFGANNRFTFDRASTLLTVGNSSVNTRISSANVMVGTADANISMFQEASNKTAIQLTNIDGTYINIINDSQDEIVLNLGNSAYFADYGNKDIRINAWTAAPNDNKFVASPDLISIGNTSVNTQVNSTSIAVGALRANNSNGSSGQVLTSNGTGTYWSTVSGGGLAESYETVNKNLKAYAASYTYSTGRISTIVYTVPPSSTITKTFNYTGDLLTSIVLSGSTPGGIQLTKTITYSGSDISSVAYS